jgi:Predicted transcriptional regulator
MEPLERLLNLVGLLLETEHPMTFDEIRRTLPAYGGDNLDSAKRKFERDKDILREYGVPLEMAATDVWDVEQGYTISKDRYYLPEIAFTPEEVTALFVAAQSASEETVAARGVRKLLYGAEGGVLAGAESGPLVAGSTRGAPVCSPPRTRPARVVACGSATGPPRGRLPDRVVDAYGVVFRGGHWYLVGHDEERNAVRAFRLSRYTTELEDVGEGSAPPEGFRAIDHVEAGPWQLSADDRALIASAPGTVVLVESTFPGVVRERTRDDGWIVLAVPAADEQALAAMLLQFGADVEALEPTDAPRRGDPAVEASAHA